MYSEVLNVRNCQRWFQKFRNGDFNLEDNERSGRPSILDDDHLRTGIEEDPCLTIGEREHLKKIGKNLAIWKMGSECSLCEKQSNESCRL